MIDKLLAVAPEIAAQGFPREIGIGDAALTALIGFMVVFFGISFLIFIVWAVGQVISKTQKSSKKQEKPAKTVKEPVKAATPVKQPVTAELTDNGQISEETVAVITAAIMAYYKQNNPKCEFTVKRIKRY